MLTIHNIKSASAAGHYFEKDNYYTQEEGIANSSWHGHGAALLDLSGGVDRENFSELLSGRVHLEISDEELGARDVTVQVGRIVKNERDENEVLHRPGYDLTFSAPKSVSLLSEVGGDDRVRQAHEVAVGRALDYVEKNAIFARVYEDGDVVRVQSDNMIVARFQHDTSRDLDPQTHTHCIVMNLTKTADGRWRSISNEDIYEQQKLIDSIYKAELAVELKALGYEITPVGKDGLYEVSGFTREQIEVFSSRSQAIEAALEARGLDRDSASAAMKEVVALDTREKKVEVDRAVLRDGWLEKAGTVGIDFETMIQTSTERQSTQPLNDSKSLIDFAISHLSERESVFQKQDVLRVALDRSYGDVGYSEIQRALDNKVAAPGIHDLGDGRITLASSLMNETEMLVRLQRGNESNVKLMSEREADVSLTRYQLNEGQHKAAQMILTSHERFVAVQGDAGTGKTHMLGAVRDSLDRADVKVVGLAPTAQAASELKAGAGIESHTVAKFLNEKNGLISGGRGGLWVVDESSFLSQKEMNSLMRLAEERSVKVAFIGDVKQLNAVSAGKPFEVAQDSGLRTERMTEILRQKNSTLQEVVKSVVEKRYDHALEKLDARTVVNSDRDQLIKVIVTDVASKGTEERSNTLVITATNRDRQAINEGIRAQLIERGELSGPSVQSSVLVNRGFTDAEKRRVDSYAVGDVVVFGRGLKSLGVEKGEVCRVEAMDRKHGVVYLNVGHESAVAWRPEKNAKVEVYGLEQRGLMQGDQIRFTKNSELVSNGTAGVVSEIRGDQAKVQTDRGVVTINLDKPGHWEHSYAMTIHASQGKTENATAFHVTSNSQKAFGERSFYVGVTRSKHDLTLYTDSKDALASMVNRDQSKSSAIESFVDSSTSKALASRAEQKERGGAEHRSGTGIER